MVVADLRTSGLDLVPARFGGIAIGGPTGTKGVDSQNCSSLSELFIFGACKAALKAAPEPLLESWRGPSAIPASLNSQGPAKLCSELRRRDAGHVHSVREEKTT